MITCVPMIGFASGTRFAFNPAVTTSGAQKAAAYNRPHWGLVRIESYPAVPNGDRSRAVRVPGHAASRDVRSRTRR